ncbi:hypothetical protein Bbelb_306550 [Branchiostoma belcheri]|nr:hypothetical protein Bbelb_306550 [Branchiostoma belcheri]
MGLHVHVHDMCGQVGWELGRPMCWASPNLKLSAVGSVTMCEGKMFHSPTVLGKKLARKRELWADIVNYVETLEEMVSGIELQDLRSESAQNQQILASCRFLRELWADIVNYAETLEEMVSGIELLRESADLGYRLFPEPSDNYTRCDT